MAATISCKAYIHTYLYAHTSARVVGKFPHCSRLFSRCSMRQVLLSIVRYVAQ